MYNQFLQRVPPAPQVMAQLYSDYKRATKDLKISFRDYLHIIGFVEKEKPLKGRDKGRRLGVGPNLGVVKVPNKQGTCRLRLIVILVDFADKVGQRPPHEYEDMLFSQHTFLTGSMRDFYREV